MGVFHPGGGTPRAEIDGQGSAGGFERKADQGNPELEIRGDGKAGESGIPVLDVGVAPRGKVAAMDRGSDQGVGDSVL